MLKVIKLPLNNHKTTKPQNHKTTKKQRNKETKKQRNKETKEFKLYCVVNPSFVTLIPPALAAPKRQEEKGNSAVALSLFDNLDPCTAVIF